MCHRPGGYGGTPNLLPIRSRSIPFAGCVILWFPGSNIAWGLNPSFSTPLLQPPPRGALPGRMDQARQSPTIANRLSPTRVKLTPIGHRLSRRTGSITPPPRQPDNGWQNPPVGFRAATPVFWFARVPSPAASFFDNLQSWRHCLNSVPPYALTEGRGTVAGAPFTPPPPFPPREERAGERRLHSQPCRQPAHTHSPKANATCPKAIYFIKRLKLSQFDHPHPANYSLTHLRKATAHREIAGAPFTPSLPAAGESGRGEEAPLPTVRASPYALTEG